MNILVISENFVRGGLETHINTYYDLINTKKDNVKMYFAFAKYEDNGYLKDATVYDNFNFSYNSSIDDFISDVNRLVSIIKKHKIDVVQVHPFYSLFPAMFAAKITNTKFIYTYHGLASINFVQAMNDSLLFSFGIEYGMDKIFCVTENVFNNFKDFHNDNIVFLPNIINENSYNEHKISPKKRWALISRLDVDKYPSIIKFLRILPKLDIDTVDIFGSGAMLEDCKKFIEENKLDEKVKFMGFKSDMSEELDDYTGTIGIGRVTLESLCMNYPSILIGQNKVVGVIDSEIYDAVKRVNFVPFTLNDISVEDLNKSIKEINNNQLEKYQFRNRIIDDFGTNNIDYYIDEISKITPVFFSIFEDVYDKIKNIKDGTQYFYTSREVFDIIFRIISASSRNLYFKEIAINYNYIYSILKRQDLIEERIGQIDCSYNKNNIFKKIKKLIKKIFRKNK